MVSFYRHIYEYLLRNPSVDVSSGESFSSFFLLFFIYLCIEGKLLASKIYDLFSILTSVELHIQLRTNRLRKDCLIMYLNLHGFGSVINQCSLAQLQGNQFSDA